MECRLLYSIPRRMTMPCAVHPDRETVASCVACGNPICESCDVLMAGKHYCRRCLAQAERVPADTAPIAPATGPRRLTRSSHDRVLAGVCGGLAAYLGWDPSLVRVLYVAITLLTAVAPSILIYAVMAWLVPSDDAPPTGGKPRWGWGCLALILAPVLFLGLLFFLSLFARAGIGS